MDKPCLHPRCPVNVPAGVSRCPKHQAEHNSRDLSLRGSASSRGYDADWQKLEARKLEADPWCERHKRRNVLRRAQLVDHVVALADGGARLAWDNLESLCRSCHGYKTADELRRRGTKTRAIPSPTPPL
jgi:5-methylcytosine-specific restriction enzyme A